MSEKTPPAPKARQANGRNGTGDNPPAEPADDSAGTEIEPSADAAERRLRADGGAAWIEMTGFQRDLLTCIRGMDEDANVPTGRTIKEELEAEYGEEINHGRLYQNLNHLIERGCIDKMVVDGRTNAYYLTDEAIEILAETAKRFVSTCDLRPPASES